MKAHTISLLHAIILIVFSVWGYLSYESASFTALIPAVIGLILIVLNRGVKNENKVIAHIAVLLTVLILFGLLKPALGAIERQDTVALFRVLVMILATVISIVFFVRSFIEARKKNT